MRIVVALLAAFMLTAEAQAAIQTEVVDYAHGDTALEGFLAYDDATTGQRPAILVVHEWKGLGVYAKRRAEQLAQLGYLAFAVDMYGKGVRAEDHTEAAQLSGLYRNDRQLMRARITVALDWLRQHRLTDTLKIAAIGYCFGGTTVLELARSGAEIAGVASFHGGLDTPTPEDAVNITGKVLVLQGGADTSTLDGVEGLIREMQGAGVDYHLITYEGVVHSFTVSEAGDDPSNGMAYDEDADKKSWQALLDFFEEIFGPTLRNVG